LVCWEFGQQFPATGALIAEPICRPCLQLILCSRDHGIKDCQQESVITVERANARLSPKPWGSHDLRPWSSLDPGATAVGEIRFERAETDALDPALLLKLLFANEALSIQVHPDDAFARSIGLTRGKTEAWYILSAMCDAKVAVGLKWRPTIQQLRSSIEDGSIAGMVCWRHVHSGDVVFVPAGTIHAIGPGLVIAEIQQRSDATFRLFDFGRPRELHIDNAVMVAYAGPVVAQTASRHLTDARTLLIACPYFVLERIDLVPNSIWQLDAASETWLLVLDGPARVGPMSRSTGETAFLDAERATIQVGSDTFSGLIAYQGTEPRQSLLNALAEQTADSSIHAVEAQS
jgi:mannose-6-phosphate isomerase